MVDVVKSWLDQGQQAHDAQQFVVDDQAISVDVFRRQGQPATTGFTEEVSSGSLLRTIVARLSSRGTEVIGLTSDTDVRVDDLWRRARVTSRPIWYRVASVDRSQTMSHVVLEEVDR